MTFTSLPSVSHSRLYIESSSAPPDFVSSSSAYRANAPSSVTSTRQRGSLMPLSISAEVATSRSSGGRSSVSMFTFRPMPVAA